MNVVVKMNRIIAVGMIAEFDVYEDEMLKLYKLLSIACES